MDEARERDEAVDVPSVWYAILQRQQFVRRGGRRAVWQCFYRRAVPIDKSQKNINKIMPRVLYVFHVDHLNLNANFFFPDRAFILLKSCRYRHISNTSRSQVGPWFRRCRYYLNAAHLAPIRFQSFENICLYIGLSLCPHLYSLNVFV